MVWNANECMLSTQAEARVCGTGVRVGWQTEVMNRIKGAWLLLAKQAPSVSDDLGGGLGLWLEGPPLCSVHTSFHPAIRIFRLAGMYLTETRNIRG